MKTSWIVLEKALYGLIVVLCLLGCGVIIALPSDSLTVGLVYKGF